MWSVWLILFLLLPGETRSSLTHSNLLCVNDYMKTIWCVWNSTAWLTGQTCVVQVTRDTHKGLKILNCSLNTTRTCVINVSTIFSFADKLLVDVICNSTWMDGLKEYRPGRYVKLHPPDQLNISGNNMTWNRGARFPKFITKYVFEVQVKANQQRWEAVKARRVDGTFALLDAVCEGDCEARVRVKPPEPTHDQQIRGFWSDWSPSVSWRSKVIGTTRGSQKPAETNLYEWNIAQPAVCGTVGGLAALILILLIPLSVYKRKCGLKMGCEHVPDPSKYFQPLIIEHKGNFQEWLGPQHSASLFLPPQSGDCEISPVDEVSVALDGTLVASASGTTPLSDSSQLSSGISNMGYFYSEHKPGSVCLDSCPVYFTYHPEGGAVLSSLSYERLRQATPTNMDSGFGMEAEKEEEEEVDDEDDATNGQTRERRGANMQHLVTFVMSLPESTRIPMIASSAELTPWHQEPESSGMGANSEAPEGAAVRPSSMVVQPCGGGYLTLREMQKYSNKSI